MSITQALNTMYQETMSEVQSKPLQIVDARIINKTFIDDKFCGICEFDPVIDQEKEYDAFKSIAIRYRDSSGYENYILPDGTQYHKTNTTQVSSPEDIALAKFKQRAQSLFN